MSFYPGPMKAPSVRLATPIPWPKPVTGEELQPVVIQYATAAEPAKHITADTWAHIIRALAGAGYSIIRRADQ